jgi:amino acid transporter
LLSDSESESGFTFQGAAAPPAGGLRRELGYWDLIVYGLCYIAPMTPLTIIGYVWQASNGLIMLVYLLGGICMFFTAKSYALMSGSVPNAGSVYGFARHSIGPTAGFLAGWLILLDYLLIPALVYVLMSLALTQLFPEIDRAVWIILLVAVTLAINWFGVTVTSRVNTLSVVVQLAVMFTFGAFGIAALHAGKGTGALTLRPLFDSAAFDPARIFAATSICILSFLGFDAISTLAEEVNDRDSRLIGRAIMSVLLLAVAFFVLFSWVSGNLLAGFIIKDPALAAYDLAAQFIGPWAVIALAWIYAVVVGFTNAIPMQVGVARVLFAMARDRKLPAPLAQVHARYGTPYVGMLVTTAISLTVALALRSRLDQLASVVNFGALTGFVLLHVSVMAHFGVRQHSRNWFTHWLVPLCGIVVVLAVLANMSHLALIVGGSWLAIGIVYAITLRILSKRDPRTA